MTLFHYICSIKTHRAYDGFLELRCSYEAFIGVCPPRWFRRVRASYDGIASYEAEDVLIVRDNICISVVANHRSRGLEKFSQKWLHKEFTQPFDRIQCRVFRTIKNGLETPLHKSWPTSPCLYNNTILRATKPIGASSTLLWSY